MSLKNLIRFVSVFFLLNNIYLCCADEEEHIGYAHIDVNLHHQKLGNLSKHASLKVYGETPNAIDFLNNDAYNSVPVKLVHYVDNIRPLFKNWSENAFTGDNVFTPFTFANLFENDVFNKKTNLHNFIDDVYSMFSGNYDEENIVNRYYLNFVMPYFVR